jgi:hypothetical protein
LQGFRVELEKNLDGLRNKYTRTTNAKIKKMFSIANPQDLICAALLRVSKPECVQNEMHELVGYVHDKYKELSEDFDFKGICSETYQV